MADSVEGSLADEELVLSDTERLVSEAPPTADEAGGRGESGRGMHYISSSRLFQTRSSILASRGVFLLGGVAFLLVGAVVAGTVRHHPVNCEPTNTSNCSCLLPSTSDLLSMTYDPSPMPTRTIDQGDSVTTHPSITPTRVSGGLATISSPVGVGLTATPTPVVITPTTPAGMIGSLMVTTPAVSSNSSLEDDAPCDCDEQTTPNATPILSL